MLQDVLCFPKWIASAKDMLLENNSEKNNISQCKFGTGPGPFGNPSSFVLQGSRPTKSHGANTILKLGQLLRDPVRYRQLWRLLILLVVLWCLFCYLY